MGAKSLRYKAHWFYLLIEYIYSMRTMLCSYLLSPNVIGDLGVGARWPRETFKFHLGSILPYPPWLCRPWGEVACLVGAP